MTYAALLGRSCPALASDPILPSGCLVMFNRAFKAFMTGTNTAMRKPTRSRPWRG